MLHEVSSGMIETRHVASPLRAFCKRARFIESEVKSIDLENKTIIFTNPIFDARLRNSIGEEQVIKLNTYLLSNDHLASKSPLRSLTTNTKNDNNSYGDINNDHYIKSLDYDYLVLALGSNTNFFGNKNLEKASFTMKSLYDAFSIRSHIIDTLEQTDMLLFEEKKM